VLTDLRGTSFYRAVALAAASLLLVVQVSFDQIVSVVAVRHGFVSAAGSMRVIFAVSVTAMLAARPFRVIVADRHSVFVDVPFVNIMHVPVVEVIGVPLMLYGGVAASRTVLVRVAVVSFAALGHRKLLEVIPLSEDVSQLS